MGPTSSESITPKESEVAQHSHVAGLRAALFGGTGAAGKEVLRQCLLEPRIAEIIAFTRRPLHTALPEGAPLERITQVHVENFLDMTPHRRALRQVDVVFWCLGVSQLTEPDPKAYRVITRDFVVATAEVLRQESPNVTFHFLSGQGAARNGFSPVMWGRAKGEAEKALASVGLRRLVVWRPTFIHAVGGRERPTRGDRAAELLYLRAIPLLTISTVDIAQGMLQTSFDDEGSNDRTFGPWKITQIARAYRRSSAQAH
jgi:uncharacterized protein YbjT (DUF2867 family)